MRPSARSDAGDSLVELLVAISILGISGAGLIGAVLMVASATAMHTQVSTSDSVLRTWAAHLDSSPYLECATPKDFAQAPEPTGWVGGPPSWTRSIGGVLYAATITDVEYWDPTGARFISRCGQDAGLQRVTISVDAPGAGLPPTSDQLVLTLRNPCTSTSEDGCSA